jgi:hypothetical protein
MEEKPGQDGREGGVEVGHHDRHAINGIGIAEQVVVR